MEAKDTVMTDKQIARVLEQQPMFKGKNLEDAIDKGDRLITKAQAEISFKAGMEKVVRFCNKEINPKYVSFDGKHYYTFSDKRWRAKLKQWGLSG